MENWWGYDGEGKERMGGGRKAGERRKQRMRGRGRRHGCRRWRGCCMVHVGNEDLDVRMKLHKGTYFNPPFSSPRRVIIHQEMQTTVIGVSAAGGGRAALRSKGNVKGEQVRETRHKKEEACASGWLVSGRSSNEDAQATWDNNLITRSRGGIEGFELEDERGRKEVNATCLLPRGTEEDGRRKGGEIERRRKGMKGRIFGKEAKTTVAAANGTRVRCHIYLKSSSLQRSLERVS